MVKPDQNAAAVPKLEDHTSPLQSTTKKRSVPSQRLLKSSNATSVLADVSSKELQIHEKCYTRKLELMERQLLALKKITTALNTKHNT